MPARTNDITVLTPAVIIGGVLHLAHLLDMTSVDVGLIGGVADAEVDADRVTAGLDAVLHGYPAGLRAPRG